MPVTPENLSKKLLALCERNDLRDRYLQHQNQSERQLNFAIFLFILSASLIVNARRSFFLDPSSLGECHKLMLSWWGDNRMVRVGDFVKSPVELIQVVQLAEYQGDSSIGSRGVNPDIPLYTLLSCSLLVRMKLYESSFLQSFSEAEDAEESSVNVLASLTEHLITGEAIDARLSVQDHLARTLRVNILAGMLIEYMVGVETLFSEVH